MGAGTTLVRPPGSCNRSGVQILLALVRLKAVKNSKLGFLSFLEKNKERKKKKKKKRNRTYFLVPYTSISKKLTRIVFMILAFYFIVLPI